MAADQERENPGAEVAQEALSLEEEQKELRHQQAFLGGRIGRTRRAGEDVGELIAENRRVSERLREVEKALAAQQESGAGETEEVLHSEVLTSTEEFAALREEWTELFEEAGVYSPFMLWEWVFPWWRYYGEGKGLHLITVRDGKGKLVGLAPMMLGFFENGRLDRRSLAIVGSGEEGPRGDYFSFILSPARREKVMRALLERVLDPGAPWDKVRLWRVRAEEAEETLAALLREGAGWTVLARQHGTCVWGPLAGSMEEFIAGMPGKTARHDLRWAEPKLREKYSEVHHVRCNAAEDLEQMLAQVHQMNVRRQQVKGRRSNWREEQSRRCLREAAELLLETGHLRVELLMVEGDPGAGRLGLVLGETCFFYESGFDPGHGRERIGKALIERSVRRSIAEGVKRLDWLSYEPYKEEFLPERHVVLDLTAVRESGRGLREVGARLWLRGVKRGLVGRRSPGEGEAERRNEVSESES